MDELPESAGKVGVVRRDLVLEVDHGELGAGLHVDLPRL